MRMSLASGGTLWLLLISGLSAQTYSVSLDVQQESWVTNSSFDQADLVKQCADAGVRVGSPDNGLVLIEYKETKGSAYGMFGIGDSGGYGTNIFYKMTLRSASDAKRLVSFQVTSGTPGSVKSGANLYREAIGALHQTPEYANSCTMIAAALGSIEQAAKLLKWAVFNPEPLKLLEAMTFAPSSASDRAYFAVARRDFSQLETLGSAAIDPLELFLKSRGITDSRKEELQATALALNTLASVGDQKQTKVFLNVLGTPYAGFKFSDAQISAALAGIAGLGKVGDVFALDTLELWATKPAPLGPAATQAAEALRARIVRR